MTEQNTKRLTLIDRTRQTKVRDPAAHARLQVSELDKAASHAESKRKQCHDNVEMDLKEIQHIDDQIAMLRLRYNPLVEHLSEAKAKRKQLVQTLEACINENQNIMGKIKDTVHSRVMNDFKLSKQAASRELQMVRGFGTGPETTYYQKKRNI